MERNSMIKSFIDAQDEKRLHDEFMKEQNSTFYKSREYTASSRYHETKNGNKILITDMETSHIENTISCFLRSRCKEHKKLIPKYYKELKRRNYFE